MYWIGAINIIINYYTNIKKKKKTLITNLKSNL